MRQLLLEAIGWLGYLERPAVVIQLLLVISLILITRLARTRRLIPRLPTSAYTPLGLLALAVAAWLLSLIGIANGLSLLIGRLWLGWYGLHLLHPLLLLCLPP